VRRFIEEFDAEEILADDLDADLDPARAEQPKQEQDA